MARRAARGGTRRTARGGRNLWPDARAAVQCGSASSGARRAWRRALLAAGVLVGACGTDAAVQEELPALVPQESPIEYPVALWDRGVQGETEIMVHVTDMGAVDSVLVAKSSGVAALDSAALAGARRVRFSPARRGDRRIAMWIRMPIRFNQDSVASLGTPTATSGE
ncbi:MAG TPA: energy transducer TonB [Longimicrobiales bacterium]|nr:energy transducer TonB [Longimicrobiales bacterium]